ncbi:MAG: SMC-Scp complex subunit ScpB [Clostridia bacterium]|jgi:segregation and condensation protein B|nr:SMC-Scp complex subunit ScpB [Clostridia bacterium]
MKLEETKAIIESMLFAAGRVIKNTEFARILEMTPEEVDEIINSLTEDFKSDLRGIELIRVNDGYQLTTKKKYYDYVVQLFDNRSKPSLSPAALETLSIIAYNPKITRAEIESIRGVNSDGTLYRLMEYNLVRDAGKSDLPGKPTTYVTTDEFLKMFGLGSLDELPELPRYKLDENEQIVLEDLENFKENKNNEESVENE